MPTIECKSRAYFLEQLKSLRAAGNTVRSVYLYWYESKGTRHLKVSAGPAARIMWNSMPVGQQTQVALSLQAQRAVAPDILELEKEYSECLMRDYETEGGSYDIRGDLNDAVFVIEYN